LKRLFIVGLLTAFSLILPLNAYSAVLINEFLPNSVNTDYEWIELLNNGSSAVNLSKFNISEESASKKFTIGDITIAPNGFVVLVRNELTFNQTFNLSGITLIDYGTAVPSLNLNDGGDSIFLYNDSGILVDSVLKYANPGENISIGRHPDGSPKTFNLTTLTPGAKNDRLAPTLNKWVAPQSNNTKISALVNITVNITDDTTQVNSSIVNFNGTNFSMVKGGEIWSFLLNTSPYIQKPYNITIFFNDSYGKAGSDALFSIMVNNSPFISAFSPPNLNQTLQENFTLSFNVNASDPDDALLNFSWFIDNMLNSTNPANFSYTPGFEGNGTHIINATIKDSSSNQVSIKWTVRVTNFNRAPVLDDIQDKTVSKNKNLRFNLTAADFDNDTLAFSSNKSAISISKINNSLATVSWTPTNLDLGSNIINFTASDGSLIGSKVMAITVDSDGNAAPAITSSPVKSGTRDELYSYDVDATDADNDTLRFSLKTNASGMSIDSATGAISFTPSSTGVFSVNASVTDFVETATQPYTLTIIVGNRLRIEDVDVKVDGKKSSNVAENSKISKEAAPGSDVEFKITVKNNFIASDGIEIDDIKVETTIEDIDDGADLEEESNEFGLNEQDDKTVTLKFKLPLNIDEGDYDVWIHADGEDQNGNLYERDYRIELEVEKEKHDLRFMEFEVSPSVVNCNRFLSIKYEVMNLGQEDEENALVEIKNAALGLNFAQKDISIDGGTEDNTFSKTTSFKIGNDIEKGAYPVTANIYSDNGRLLGAKTAEIKVDDCIKIGETEEPEVVLVTGQAQEEPKKTQAVKEPIRAAKTQVVAKESSNLQLLLLSSFVLTMGFLVTAIILFLIA